MINRRNYLDIRHWLDYHARARQNTAATVARLRGHTRHLLEWADAQPLTNARQIDPVYPVYLARLNLAPATVRKNLAVARQFFRFAHVEWPVRYKALSQSWIDTLRPPREMRGPAIPRHDMYTLADMMAIASYQPDSLRLARAQAGACLLYLSGMRSGALTSLPISAIDLVNRSIMQDPSIGVKTKNRKAAITYLLNIPPLLDIVQQWDARVRADLPRNALWYAGVNSTNACLLAITTASDYSRNRLRNDIVQLCAAVGLPYKSPHKFRHGHVVYAIKRARDMAQLKAISQNVMHASVTITDQIYGALVDDDVRDIIGGL